MVMDIIDFDTLQPDFLEASAVTVGNFDGVHLGHRAIIDRVLEYAGELGAPPVVITFDPHPREVIFHGQIVPAIIPFSERARLIEELGVEILVKVHFTREFADQSAGWFVDEMTSRLHPRAVVIGHDFRFGRGREGDYDFLSRAGAEAGFEVSAVSAVEIGDKPVSSTRIRGLIQAGEMRRAHRLLGSPFCLIGEVVHGHGRGKDLGFATANLKWDNRIIPPDGVYAAVAVGEGIRHPAVVNIGSNPTFGDQAVSIEAHIMGFTGDLYGRPLRVALYRRLRGEIKFASPAALVAQIKEDIRRARAELLHETGEDLFALVGIPEDQEAVEG